MTETNVIRPALFRAESLEARQLAWQGRPALALGYPTLFTTLASVALAAATAALLTFGSYARRVDMEGAVLPDSGVIAIAATAPGRIEKLAVSEGESVRKGALLYRVDVDTATAGGGVQQQIIKSEEAERAMLAQQIDRKTRMSAQGATELQGKIKGLEAQLNQVSGQITQQQGIVMQLSKQYMAFSDLVRRHIVSVDELTTRYQAYLQAFARLEDLESSQGHLQDALKDARSQLTTSAQNRGDEIDAIKGRIIKLDEQLTESEARRAIEIRAPVAGVITAITGEPGQTVGPGTTMLKIVPPRHAPMQAELLAPSSAIGFLRQGERVRLRYSAFPYQKFGEYRGIIVTISRAPLGAEEVKNLLAGMPPKPGGPLYRIIVKPDTQRISIDGKEHALPTGMQVQATALLDRRALYQWILEPLYDVGRAVHGS